MVAQRLEKIAMSDLLEGRERLDRAHKQLQDAMTQLIAKKTIRKLNAYCSSSTNLCSI